MWEYKAVQQNTLNQLVGVLNEYAQQGWEAIQVVPQDNQSFHAVLKRNKDHKVKAVKCPMCHRELEYGNICYNCR